MGLIRDRPFITVIVGEKPVNSIFYERLLTATITDNPDDEADTFEADFDDVGNDLAIPKAGAEVQVTFGYHDAISQLMGRFVIETVSVEGGSNGEVIRLCGKSASMNEDVKEQASEHFDEGTLVQIVDRLARRHGYQSKVSDELKNKRVPYIVRTNQSATDFLTRLADRFRATFLVKDNKFLFLTRGALPPLQLTKSDCSEWSFEIEPRTKYGTVEADYFDREKGQRSTCSHETGLAGPVRRLRNCYPTKEEAEAAAASEGDRLCRSTGTGSITLPGMPEMMADQPLELVGFRPEIDGLWRAGTVTHTYDTSSGYITEITIEAPEEGKTTEEDKEE